MRQPGMVQHLLLICFALWGATAGAGPSDPTAADGCITGCPHMLELVCGADGTTYQSRCLALCQGVQVVSDGPCEEEAPHRRAGRLQLHKLLINTQAQTEDSQTQQRHRTDHDTTEQPQAAGSRRSLAGVRRVLTQADMVMFKEQGFKLVGRVEMKEQASEHCDHEESSQDAAFAALGAAKNPTTPARVRALRITNDGLLYTASYDLQALSKAIKDAAEETAVGALDADIGAEAEGEEGEAGDQGGEDGEDEPAADVKLCNGLPALPHYNPHKRRQQQEVQQQQQSRRLLQQKKPPPPAKTVKLAQEDPPSPPPRRATMTSCSSDAFPVTAIGQLQLRDSNGAYVCSGSMVGPDSMLTAAHCVFRRESGGGGSFYSRLDFAPGRYLGDGKVQNPYGVGSWRWATILDAYETVPSTSEARIFNYDMSVVKLVEPLGNDAGWLGIAPGCPVNPATGKPAQSYVVSTAGYPSAWPFGTCLTSRCAITNDNCGPTASHTCNSLSGQSGSPFYMNKDFRIRGILVGTYNSGGAQVKVAHIVGYSDSYAAALRWIGEDWQDPLQDSEMLRGSASGSATTPSDPPGPDSTTPDKGNTTQDSGDIPNGFPEPPLPDDVDLAPVYPPSKSSSKSANVTTEMGTVTNVTMHLGVPQHHDDMQSESPLVDPPGKVSGAGSRQTDSKAAAGATAKRAKKWVRKARKQRGGRRLAQAQQGSSGGGFR